MRRTITLGCCSLLFSAVCATYALAYERSEHPAQFKAIDKSLRNLPVETVLSIRKDANWIDKPWPFTGDEVLIACAKPAMNVVKSGSNYAALNGNTSSGIKRYQLVEQNGKTSSFFEATDHDGLRRAALVQSGASGSDIAEWWRAMNTVLLRTCGT